MSKEVKEALIVMATISALGTSVPAPLPPTNGGRGILGKKKSKNKDKRRLRKLKKQSQRRNR